MPKVRHSTLPRSPPESEEMVLPDDVCPWSMALSGPHHARHEGFSAMLWYSFVLRGDRRRLPSFLSRDTQRVHVFVVRSDGFVVQHQTGPHKPESIFQIYDVPQPVAHLRRFMNVENTVLPEWPQDLVGIPRTHRRMVVIVAVGEVEGKPVRRRHVFFYGEHHDSLWETRTTPAVIELPGNNGNTIMSRKRSRGGGKGAVLRVAAS